ncbi:MAG: RtcB family protein [Dehalococcoidia bacterium]
MPRWQEKLRKVDDYRWEIPQSYKPGMRVPGLIYADKAMLDLIGEEEAPEQVANVAFLPGIVGRSLAMPDLHWGYGFPIGGVAATRVEGGVISPGGVGFDINCGVRLLSTQLTEEEVRPRIRDLVAGLYNNVPSGLGVGGKLRVDEREMDRVLVDGALWAIERGYGEKDDPPAIEEGGSMKGADPSRVSARAKKRGTPQLGTLGSGNHFLEVGAVEEIYDSATAKAFGIEALGQVVLWVHTGSRGLGHQVCDEYVKSMVETVRKYGIDLPDRQLACAPFESPEGQAYFAAMASAANYAWANRQCITHWALEVFSEIFGKGRQDLGIHLIYDVAHNIAKIEQHVVDGQELKVVVHRKGATRAFPPHHPDLSPIYSEVGQPVLIPGDMGRYSYIAVGTEVAMMETFGSTCHGAGRVQSRTAAKRNLRGQDISQRLASRGITVMAGNRAALAEEASEAYKDVSHVVEITHQAGISRKVARTRPLGVIKG